MNKFMDTISKTIRRRAEAISRQSQIMGYVYFYLRARELGFAHGEIMKTIKHILK